jgi:hypothetical protein
VVNSTGGYAQEEEDGLILLQGQPLAVLKTKDTFFSSVLKVKESKVDLESTNPKHPLSYPRLAQAKDRWEKLGKVAPTISGNFICEYK